MTPILLFAALQAPTEIDSLARKFVPGEVDRYALTMTLQGTVEFIASARLSQTVKKVWDNGDADVETRVDDLKMTMMGDVMKTPKQKPVTVRTSPLGVPAEAKASAGVQGIDMLRYVLVAPAGKLELDKPVPFTTDEKSLATGTVKLEKIENGVADLRYDLAVDVKAPAKIALRALRRVEIATGKTVRADGEMTNLPQPSAGRLDGIVFTFVRS